MWRGLQWAGRSRQTVLPLPNLCRPRNLSWSRIRHRYHHRLVEDRCFLHHRYHQWCRHLVDKSLVGRNSKPSHPESTRTRSTYSLCLPRQRASPKSLRRARACLHRHRSNLLELGAHRDQYRVHHRAQWGSSLKPRHSLLWSHTHQHRDSRSRLHRPQVGRTRSIHRECRSS